MLEGDITSVIITVCRLFQPDLVNFRRELLPVMVFIHWGGFFAGRGTSDYLGPEYLMEKDIILVTFNYRLGVFGKNSR